MALELFTDPDDGLEVVFDEATGDAIWGRSSRDPQSSEFRSVGGREYDLTAYIGNLNQLLTDVWNDAFYYWDCRVDTQAAADLATRCQDLAEHKWRGYFSVPFKSRVW